MLETKKDTIEIDFRTNLELKSPVYQLCLAAQQEGTFYCVYVKFTPVENSKNKYTTTFRLQPYRGQVKMGIHNVELRKENNGSKKFVHFNITIGRTKENTEFSFRKEIRLRKKMYIIIQREDIAPESKSYLIAQNSMINIQNNSSYKTHEQVEQELVVREIEKVKKQLENDTLPQTGNTEPSFSTQAASLGFCAYGINKLL